MKNNNILKVAIGTVLLLLIPFIAMQFSKEVNWSPFDFCVAGLLLFGTGLTYMLVSRRSSNTTFRFAVGLSVMASLMLIWINLAVGIIGSENNPINLMYGGVLLVGIIGGIISRLHARGLSLTLFSMAVAQMFVPIIGLVFWKSNTSFDEAPGILGIFALNAFFSVLFAGAGFLFRQSSSMGAKQNEQLIEQHF